MYILDKVWETSGRQSIIEGLMSFFCNAMQRNNPRDHKMMCFASPISMPLIFLITGRNVIQQIFLTGYDFHQYH